MMAHQVFNQYENLGFLGWIHGVEMAQLGRARLKKSAIKWVSGLSTVSGAVAIPSGLSDLLSAPEWTFNVGLGLVVSGPCLYGASWAIGRVREARLQMTAFSGLVSALDDLLRKSEILRKRTTTHCLMECITGVTTISAFVKELTEDLLRELGHGLRMANGGKLQVTASIVRLESNHSATDSKGPLTVVYDFPSRRADRQEAEKRYYAQSQGTLGHLVLESGAPLSFDSLDEVTGVHNPNAWQNMGEWIGSGILVPVVQNESASCVLQVDSIEQSAFSDCSLPFVKCTAEAIGCIHQLAAVLASCFELIQAERSARKKSDQLVQAKTQLYEAEMERMRAKVDDLVAQKSDAEDHCSTLEQAAITFQNELAEIAIEIQCKKDEVRAKEQEITKLKKQLRDAKKEIKVLQRDSK